MNNIVKLFKALGDESRLKILLLISKRNVCAKGISKHLDISEAAVSQHIKVLKEANLITGYKKGYFMHYSINEDALNTLIDFTNEIKNPNYKCLGTLNLPEKPCDKKIRCNKSCKNINLKGE